MIWEQKIIDIQCGSTKALMREQRLRPESEDKNYALMRMLAPLPKEAQCVKEDGTVDLNVRELSHEEAIFHQGVRSVAGRRIEEARGNEPVSTITDAKRERATTAFMGKITLAAIKERFKTLMGDVFKPSYAEIVAAEIRKRRET